MSRSADLADIPSEALASLLARNTGANHVMVDEEAVPVTEVRDEVLARYRALPSSLAQDVVGLRLTHRTTQLSVQERQALARVSLGIEVTAATFRKNAHPAFAELATDVLARLPRVNFHQQEHTRETALTQRLCIDIFVARQILTPEKVGAPRARVGEYHDFEQKLRSGSMAMSANSQSITNRVINAMAAIHAFEEPADEVVDSDVIAQQVEAFLLAAGSGS